MNMQRLVAKSVNHLITKEQPELLPGASWKSWWCWNNHSKDHHRRWALDIRLWHWSKTLVITVGWQRIFMHKRVRQSWFSVKVMLMVSLILMELCILNVCLKFKPVNYKGLWRGCAKKFTKRPQFVTRQHMVSSQLQMHQPTQSCSFISIVWEIRLPSSSLLTLHDVFLFPNGKQVLQGCRSIPLMTLRIRHRHWKIFRNKHSRTAW